MNPEKAAKTSNLRTTTRNPVNNYEEKPGTSSARNHGKHSMRNISLLQKPQKAVRMKPYEKVQQSSKEYFGTNTGSSPLREIPSETSNEIPREAIGSIPAGRKLTEVS